MSTRYVWEKWNRGTGYSESYEDYYRLDASWNPGTQIYMSNSYTFDVSSGMYSL